MRLNRFFLNYNPNEKIISLKEKELIHQIKNVLRLKEGEKIVIFQDDLKEAISRIIKIDKNFIDLEIMEIRTNLREPQREVILYCALLKKENFELVIQKATEIGVKKIVPLLTERTVKTNLNKERLRKIIKEASEQAGRGIIPQLSEPIILKEAFLNSCIKDKIFFHLEGNSFNKGILKNKKQVTIFIGPEGGWSEKEIKLAKENNCVFVNLSPFTFRAETAAIIATYLAVYF